MAGRMISHKRKRAANVSRESTEECVESETRMVQDQRLHDNVRAPGLHRDRSFSPSHLAKGRHWQLVGRKSGQSIDSRGLTLACLFSLPLLALGPLSR